MDQAGSCFNTGSTGSNNSGSGSSAGRIQPSKIQGAASLFSLRSAMKDETDFRKRSRVRKLERGCSFDFENEPAVEEVCDERHDDSDGLWGDDEDDGEGHG